ncbi:hypothetical protein Aca07nite_24000 [Actinoplanes capillaceus]|uniref:PknH-like extracellular domain-containing protein n=1 Tax=Actinoplanes campanulatus TaxID=113559 RepID=A0ABQ3WGA1_9ACTN|nr:hypothetical protein Aca07nite_24000 [Actinoplanes capillaceus]
MIGVTGLAAVLGTGAYVITGQVLADRHADVIRGQRIVAPSPVAPASTSGSPEPSATPTAASKKASPTPSTAAEEIKEARRKMAKDGVEVQRPVAPKSTTSADDVKTTTEGSLKEGGIVRMVTARGDLTGRGELAYVAGGVRKHRNASCSQTFQFSTNPRPAKKDNLLMCWRTSPVKSVLAIVVDPKGRPSRDKAVDALEKSWRAMG